MGEHVVISREGKPLVRITTLNKLKQRIKFGVMKSKITIGSDFDAAASAFAVQVKRALMLI